MAGKYFILGSGTKFHRNASADERKYGALCGASGTMVDGSEGYKLW